MKIVLKLVQNFAKYQIILTKVFKFLPKWQNFAKSGYTGLVLKHREHSSQKTLTIGGSTYHIITGLQFDWFGFRSFIT